MVAQPEHEDGFGSPFIKLPAFEPPDTSIDDPEEQTLLLLLVGPEKTSRAK